MDLKIYIGLNAEWHSSVFILNIICTEPAKRLMHFTNGLCCFGISAFSLLNVIVCENNRDIGKINLKSSDYEIHIPFGLCKRQSVHSDSSGYSSYQITPIPHLSSANGLLRLTECLYFIPKFDCHPKPNLFKVLD